jgi:putative cardiolipin synthase
MRSLALLGNFERINHRMHNKLFIADNQLAIFGGRNIGNMYFGVDKQKNFRDMDILALGQQVESISLAFDDYWNSTWAYNVKLVEKNHYSLSDFTVARQSFDQHISNFNNFPYQIPARKELLAILDNFKDRLDWATLSVYADPPRKDLHDDSSHVYHRLKSANLTAQNTSLTSSPYFIPTESMIKQAKKLVDKGVTVKILTNSLSSNDVTMAQYGYADRRKSLLKSGVELYEMREDALDREDYTAEKYRDTAIGLHAKVSVIDDKRVLIGSFNIDPRSTLINTEVVIVIESKALADKVKQALLKDISPRNSYQVFLETNNNGHSKLRWQGEENGEMVVHRHEPNTNFLKVFGELVFGLLPIDDQL